MVRRLLCLAFPLHCVAYTGHGKGAEASQVPAETKDLGNLWSAESPQAVQDDAQMQTACCRGSANAEPAGQCEHEAQRHSLLCPMPKIAMPQTSALSGARPGQGPRA